MLAPDRLSVRDYRAGLSMAPHQHDEASLNLLVLGDYIHGHALRPLGLGEVAAAAGRHEIHLAREFRRCFGVSVGAYQRRLRIEHAAQRLQEGGLSLSEVALKCGFSSHAHLCREFKAQRGVTPSQHRATAGRSSGGGQLG